MDNVTRVELYFADGKMIGTESQREIDFINEALQESKRSVVQFVELPVSRYSVNLQNVSYIKFI